ncbi:hypothetical protein THIAE_07215 [Thiomicrospira aerophila AL3]|uniref:Flagellar hook-length control protein-like C-terminal domain-containing protein n=1 Tax=Thiomicrospira aerophila AL3 TaxID=717772 RepID=W0DYI0_9GAMM|nr:flagellar hook-length control protein FliK [Thiomicrospira aerophila]AHF02323.1 hypothetical protein THIAE_07215 [Thiomicrospira aerophila AL3]
MLSFMPGLNQVDVPKPVPFGLAFVPSEPNPSADQAGFANMLAQLLNTQSRENRMASQLNPVNPGSDQPIDFKFNQATMPAVAVLDTDLPMIGADLVVTRQELPVAHNLQPVAEAVIREIAGLNLSQRLADPVKTSLQIIDVTLPASNLVDLGFEFERDVVLSVPAEVLRFATAQVGVDAELNIDVELDQAGQSPTALDPNSVAVKPTALKMPPFVEFAVKNEEGSNAVVEELSAWLVSNPTASDLEQVLLTEPSKSPKLDFFGLPQTDKQITSLLPFEVSLASEAQSFDLPQLFDRLIAQDDSAVKWVPLELSVSQLEEVALPPVMQTLVDQALSEGKSEIEILLPQQVMAWGVEAVEQLAARDLGAVNFNIAQIVAGQSQSVPIVTPPVAVLPLSDVAQKSSLPQQLFVPGLGLAINSSVDAATVQSLNPRSFASVPLTVPISNGLRLGSASVDNGLSLASKAADNSRSAGLLTGLFEVGGVKSAPIQSAALPIQATLAHNNQVIEQAIQTQMSAVTTESSEDDSSSVVNLMQVAQMPTTMSLSERAPVTLPAINYALRQAQWETALGQRLMYMINQQVSQAQIQLNPANLGPIRLMVSLDRDQVVQVQMLAQHAQTKDAMEQALPRLRDMLTEAGIKFDQLQVAQGSADNNSSQFFKGGQPQNSTHSGQAGLNDEEPLEALAVTTNKFNSNTIDFYV